MSKSCPLCGKNKPDKALFCGDCAKKIHAEFEVDVPGKADHLEEVPDEPDMVEETPDFGNREGELNSEDKPETPDESVLNDFTAETDPVEDPVDGTIDETIDGTIDKTVDGTIDETVDGTIDETGHDKEDSEEKFQTKTNTTNRRKFVIPVLFLFVTAFLVVAFMVYDTTIRKNNLDRSGWEAAVKSNSVEGYLAYMEAHPNGMHFDEAQAGLRMLKTEEAVSWEKMKESDNATELRDFLAQHPESPYTSLVKTRLDSLLWIGALRTNTEESYSNYIRLTENNEIKGDYIAEAQKRYKMLFNAQAPDATVLDSIRTTMDGFFISLSSLDHNGMSRFLAPMVHRFFDSGAAARERIIGELHVAGARTEGETLKFFPDLQSVRYEVTANHHYKANLPLHKTYQKDGATEQVHGYIVHAELDPHFQIVSIYETKPYPEAP